VVSDGRVRKPAAHALVETALVDLALRIVHLLAAIVWAGGTVALVFVAVPPVQRLQGPERAALLREFGRRWRPIGWSSLGVAVVTGLVLAQRAHAFDGAPHDFDWVLAAMGLLVGLLDAGAYLHDFVLGPGLASQVREGRAQSLRPLLVGIGRANLLLTVAIPILGAVLGDLLDS
jgi:putative copper export protein